MSVKATFFIFFALFGYLAVSSAQDTAIVPAPPDSSEQPDSTSFNLSPPCTAYAQIFGFNTDSVGQPELFATITDWLGTPYRYSGDSKQGIDCSGFVCLLCRKVYGVELSNSSKEIFTNNVSPLKAKNMLAGDLVFFKIKKKRISHVGIYVGNNKFAHASVQNGVIISDLSEPYYKKYFYKAGRINREKNPQE